MLLASAHAEGMRVVHVTHTTLVLEALCGEQVAFHDEPELSVVCDECLELARALGADLETWVSGAGVQSDAQVESDAQLPLAA